MGNGQTFICQLIRYAYIYSAFMERHENVLMLHVVTKITLRSEDIGVSEQVFGRSKIMQQTEYK